MFGSTISKPAYQSTYHMKLVSDQVQVESSIEYGSDKGVDSFYIQ
jgi:poly(A) polymerase Pap1